MASVFGSGLAVAWRSRDWQLSESRLYPYLQSSGIDMLVTKGWFHVELRQRRTQRPLRILNTHMQADFDVAGEYFRYITEPIRIAQAQQLVAVERGLPSVPTLLLGDMNTEDCWFPGTVGWMRATHEHTFPESGQILDHCTTWTAGPPCEFVDHAVLKPVPPAPRPRDGGRLNARSCGLPPTFHSFLPAFAAHGV